MSQCVQLGIVPGTQKALYISQFIFIFNYHSIIVLNIVLDIA